MKTRSIEMYVLWTGSGGDSGTWSTTFVDIPAKTSENKVAEVAIAKLEEQLYKSSKDFALVGVYCNHEGNYEEEDD